MKNKFTSLNVLAITLLLISLGTTPAVYGQIITTIAGTGTGSYTGDGGSATTAAINNPLGFSIDGSGNIFIADYSNNRIRKITPAGVISTVAGNGTAGFSGDGGAATAAKLNSPSDVIIDASGNLYIADYTNQRVRKVSTSGIISTVSGTGTSGYTGDGGPATAAKLSYPQALAFDNSGNIIVADEANDRIRKITLAGVISTIAGGGSGGLGDGGAATAATLYRPAGVVYDASGNLYISDCQNNRIRKVSTAGVITTFAGTGTGTYSGDGGPATAADIYYPNHLAFDGAGNLYFADAYNNRVRKISTSGTISTIAGTGTSGFSGDGGQATAAKLSNPTDVYVDGSGNIYLTDAVNNRMRKISPGSTSAITLAQTASTLAVYPVPNSGTFQVKFTSPAVSDVLVIITDLSGRAVQELTLTPNQETTVHLNVSPGIYLISVTSGSEKASAKLIVE